MSHLSVASSALQVYGWASGELLLNSDVFYPSRILTFEMVSIFRIWKPIIRAFSMVLRSHQ